MILNNKLISCVAERGCREGEAGTCNREDQRWSSCQYCHCPAVRSPGYGRSVQYMDPACCCGIDSTDCICCWLPVDYVFCVAIFAGFWSFTEFEKSKSCKSFWWCLLPKSIMWVKEYYSYPWIEWDFSLGVGNLWFSVGFFLHTISIISFHLWCMLKGSVWIWMKEQPVLVHWGQTHFSTSWQNEFDLQWTNIECSLFKPPHYLQACTKNLPNMEVRRFTTYLPENSAMCTVELRCSYNQETRFWHDESYLIFIGCRKVQKLHVSFAMPTF